MAPLSQEQIARLQVGISTLLAEHGLTGGYLVAEHRVDKAESAQHTVVAVAAVPTSKPSLFLEAMAKQTYTIIRSVGKMEVNLRDN